MPIHRFTQNPILAPARVRPSRPDLVVECLLNPGAFRHQGRVGLLMRIAERPLQEKDWVSTPIPDPTAEAGVSILRIPRDHPELVMEQEDEILATL